MNTDHFCFRRPVISGKYVYPILYCITVPPYCSGCILPFIQNKLILDDNVKLV